MKSFQQFITEVYDKELSTATREPGEGGRVRASRKKTEPEKRRTKAIGGGKTAPAKDYKPRKDIGTQKPRSDREQQPERKRGSASLTPREQQKKARAERLAAKSGGKSNKKDLEKKATELLKKRVKAKVDPNYKPQKSSGYNNKERRQIRRQGSKLLTHIQKGIEKSASNYQPKKINK
jgi:hypothetical protein